MRYILTVINVNATTKKSAKTNWPVENMLIFLAKLGNLNHLYDSKKLNAVQAFHEAFKIGHANAPTVDLPTKLRSCVFV